MGCPRENPRSLSCLRAEILGGVPVGLVDLAVSLVDLAVGLVDRVGTGALDVLAKTPGLYHVSELRYWVECRSAWSTWRSAWSTELGPVPLMSSQKPQVSIMSQS